MANNGISDSTMSKLHELFLNSYNFQKSFLGSPEVALSTYVTQSFKKLHTHGTEDSGENEVFQWGIQCLRNPCVYLEKTVDDVDNSKSLVDVLFQRVMVEEDLVPCFVVLGDSGMGKTTLALSLMEKIWRESKENTILNRVPIYIHLPAEFRCLNDVSLQTFLTLRNFIPEAINEILNQPLLLVLDGFDEIHTTSNIFMQISNDLPRDDAKVIILSRLEELPADRGTRADLFGPPDGQFDEYVLEPFDSKRISQYTTKFTKAVQHMNLKEVKGTLWDLAKTSVEGTEWSGNPEKYMTWMDRIVELGALAQNPFLLTLILLTLPKIVQQSKDTKQTNIRKLCSTRVGIFDSFTDNWFRFQAQKLVDAKVPFSRFGVSYIQRYCRVYAQNVAHTLIQDNGLLCDDPIEVSAANDIDFLQPAFDEDLLHHFDQHKDFLEKCDAIFAIRRGCLTQFRENEFRFFHRSLAEYFAARELFDGVQGEFDCHLNNIVSLRKRPGLNRELIKDKQLLLQLAERANLDDRGFSQTLYAIIRKSSEVSSIALMSSNAITILNLAGKSLSGENFQYVQIPNANLSHSLCGNTDFRGANLSGVQFNESYLVKSKFQGAKMIDVDFGEHTIMVSDDVVFHVALYIKKKNEKHYLMVGSIPDGTACDRPTRHFVVTQWSLSTGKKKRTFKHKESSDFKPHYQVCSNNVLATSGHIINLFSIARGCLLRKLTFPDCPFTDFAFVDCDLKWTVCVEEKTFHIHEFESNFRVCNEPAYTFTQEKRDDRFPLTIRRMLFDPCSKTFVVQPNQHIKIVAFPFREQKKMIEILETNLGHTLTAVAVDPTGNICCLGEGLHITFLGMFTGEKIQKLQYAHDDQINCLQFKKDSNLLASGSDDCSIKIWKYDPVTFKSLELYKQLRGYPTPVMSVAFCHENTISIAAVLIHDKRVRIQSITGDGCAPFTGEKFSKRYLVNYDIWSQSNSENFAILSSAKLEATNTEKGVLEVFDIHTGETTAKFKVRYDSRVHCLALLKEKFILLIQGYEGFYRQKKQIEVEKQNMFNALIYDECGDIITDHVLHNIEVKTYTTKMFLNHQQNVLACTLADGSIQLYDISFNLNAPTKEVICTTKILLTDKEFNIQNCAGHAKEVFFSPVGDVCGSSSWNIDGYGLIRIWDVTSGQLIRKFECDCHKYCKMLSNHLVSCREKYGKITFTKVKPGDTSYSMASFGHWIHDIAVAEDLNLFAASGHHQDGIESLSLYELQSHKLILKLPLWFCAYKIWILPCTKTEEPLQPPNVHVLLLDVGYYFDADVACLELSKMPDGCWQWRFLWSSSSKCMLFTDALEMTQAFCLSRQNQGVLTLYGAVGKAASDQYPFISRPLLLRPLIGTSVLDPAEPLIRALCPKQLTIDANNWVVTAVVSSKHAFLILEGVYHRRFVVRADLTYNEKEKEIFILTNPKTRKQLQKFRVRVSSLKGNQWNITADQGMQLLMNIMEDKQKHLGPYNMLTNNCVSWAVAHLRIVGMSYPNHWYNAIAILPSNVLEGQASDSGNDGQVSSGRVGRGGDLWPVSPLD